MAKNTKCSISVFQKYQNSTFRTEQNLFASLQVDTGCVPAQSLQRAGHESNCFQDTLKSGGNRAWRLKLPYGSSSNIAQRKYAMLISCQYSHSTNNDQELSREFFVKLWIKDKKRKGYEERQRLKVLNHARFRTHTGPQFATEDPLLRQIPVTQSLTGALRPSSPEEAKVAPLLARSHLLITRDIEWANLIAALEQESRYLIVDAHHPMSPVGAIREKSNFLSRQLLRTRRPFVAYVYDGLGNELFRVRRPFWWVTSSIFVEINGKEVGVVHRRWHLWRRNYDLYLGNKQFAAVENPGLWNWTFTLQDIDGAVLAEINRNWRGFGFELFTDAGQYVIRFGNADPTAFRLPGIDELEVKRPLTLSERAVALALAINLDCDYFSRHGGSMLPFLIATE